MNSHIETNLNATATNLNATAKDVAQTLPEVLPLRALVFGGSLGSGKTSLINSILTRQAESLGSFVVIENDIGSRNVDKSRLLADPQQIMALTSGCICCNDLTSLKVSVAGLRDLPPGDRPSTIIIETTGIADPASVKKALYELNVPALLILTLDVKHFHQNSALGRGISGLSAADIFAFTWWDHDKGVFDLKRVVKSAREANPFAKAIYVRSNGEIRGTSIGRDTFADGKPEAELGTDGDRVISFSNLFRHREVALSLRLKGSVAVQDIVKLLNDVAGESLIRVKGYCEKHEIDCVRGDWHVRESSRFVAVPYINVITTHPIDISMLENVVDSSQTETTPDLSTTEAMSTAQTLVRELIEDFPQVVVSPRGNLTTECDAGEGWRYVSHPDFPSELRNDFLSELASFYWRQLIAIKSGELNSHPSFPFYQKEVGANLSWLMFDCPDILEKLQIKGLVAAERPCHLYFLGLKNLTLPGQLASLQDKDLPYLRARIKEVEFDGRIGVDLVDEALSNAKRLSFDGSWNDARSKLEKLS